MIGVPRAAVLAGGSGIVTVIAALGVVVTIFALFRFIRAWKRNEGRDAMMGWLSVMIGSAAVVFLVDRVL